jgi:hypothetical protein
MIEKLAETPPLPPFTASTTASMQRLIYEPGATLDLDFPGPALYYVERGSLSFHFDGERLSIVYPPEGRNSGRVEIFEDAESRVTIGYAVYAADGALGATLNSGDAPLVVLALLLAPQPSDAEVGVDTTEATAVASPDLGGLSW